MTRMKIMKKQRRMMKKHLNNSISSFIVITSLLLFGAGAVYGDNVWTKIATLKAGVGVQELKVNRKISKVSITCTEGSVTVKTIEVVNNEKSFSFNVGNKLTKEQSQQITVGSALMCETLKITDDGNGRYEVKVRD